MAVFVLIGSLAAPLIGNIAWIAVLMTIAVVCGAIVYRQAKRQRQDWESDRS